VRPPYADRREGRFAALFDGGTHELLPAPNVPQDPLHFRDETSRYFRPPEGVAAPDRAQGCDARAKGLLDGIPVVIACKAFEFRAVRSAWRRGPRSLPRDENRGRREAAVRSFSSRPAERGCRKAILLADADARTTVGVDMLDEAGAPLHRDPDRPTTGGVSASYPMLGDVQIAEPGALSRNFRVRA